MPNSLSAILDQPTLRHVRRNHALEHATIHLLSSRLPRTPLVGRSDSHGFFLLGEVPTAEVERAATEALARLQAGEARLAIHPNCGTNLVLSAFLAGGASFLVAQSSRPRNWRDRLDQLPLIVLAAFLALVVAQPLGTATQRRVTTEARPGNLRILEVRRWREGRPTIHRILTAD